MAEYNDELKSMDAVLKKLLKKGGDY